jgi:SAM-dependent methyltransferase
MRRALPMSVDPPLDYGQVAGHFDASRRVEPSILNALEAGLRELRAKSVLEIGAGTGNYGAALAARGFRAIALEREPAMLQRGCVKGTAQWLRADAHRLPLRAGAVDAVCGVNVLHHLGDLRAALAELAHVTRFGAVMQAVVRENLETLWYRRFFPEMDSVLLPLHPPLGALVTALLNAGFHRVRCATIFYSGAADMTFEAARTRPRILFDPTFRAATSGFRRLSAECIVRGLAMLEDALESGRFDAVARPFDAAHAEAGDCVVLTASFR